MLVTGGLTMLLGGWAFAGAQRDPLTKAGVSYAASLIAVGVLISFANCLSTFYGARFYLPVYTLFQMGLLLAISLVGSFFYGKAGTGKTGKF